LPAHSAFLKKKGIASFLLVLTPYSTEDEMELHPVSYKDEQEAMVMEDKVARAIQTGESLVWLIFLALAFILLVGR
jgi:hypothetical protein